MATYVPQRELRNNPGAVLARVEAGEELTITVRGRPVADLVPTSEAGRRSRSVAAFAAGLRQILGDDESFARDLDRIRQESKGDLVRDPFAADDQ